MAGVTGGLGWPAADEVSGDPDARGAHLGWPEKAGEGEPGPSGVPQSGSAAAGGEPGRGDPS